MYSVDGVLGLLGQQPTGRRSYIYARVSSAKQRNDLDRQIDDLKKAYPGHDIIKDVASGVNFKRKGLQTLLEHVLAGLVSEIVVMHRDRLARIGCDLLEFIFNKAGTKLVVHGTDEDAEDHHDLADDLLAVTTLFVASYNGRRAAENRKRRREDKKGNEKTKGPRTKESNETQEDVREPGPSSQDQDLSG
jgi:predicted site-specific integrase-resolvase